MKRYLLFIIGAVLALTACNDDAVDGLSGLYGDMRNYDFPTANVQPTTKLRHGIKALNIDLTDGQHTMAATLGSKEWTLQEGTYTFTDNVTTANQLSGNIDGTAISAGEVDVNIVDSTYFLSGIVTTADNVRNKVYYKGPLSFIIGEDDPEASGYVMNLKKDVVAQYDWATGQTTVYPDVTKYILTFTDPDGNAAGEFDLIAANNLSATQLAGTYTLQGSSVTAGLCDAGWVVPAYGMAGGSFYTDNSGVKQYATAGQVTLSVNEDADGNPLFSIAGTGISTTTADGAQTSTTGAFSIRFASYIEVKGTVMRDLAIQSTTLSREMKYSIYLPEGYDGKTKLPVVYMLHGYGGNNNSWLDDGNLAALTSQAMSNGTMGKAIIVMPDGLSSFYANGYQDGMQYKDYFFNELLPTVEAMFNCGGSQQMRAIGGLSMGGYGTLLYTVEHPDMFCLAYAMSPAAFVENTPNLFDLYGAADVSKLPDLTIEVGTEDPVVFQTASYLGQMLQAMPLPTYEYITRSGVHDWAFWQGCYPKMLAKLGKYFK